MAAVMARRSNAESVSSVVGRSNVTTHCQRAVVKPVNGSTMDWLAYSPKMTVMEGKPAMERQAMKAKPPTNGAPIAASAESFAGMELLSVEQMNRLAAIIAIGTTKKIPGPRVKLASRAKAAGRSSDPQHPCRNFAAIRFSLAPIR